MSKRAVEPGLEVPETRLSTRMWQSRTSGARASQVILPVLCVLTDTSAILTCLLSAASLRTRMPVLDGANDVADLVARIGGFVLVGWLVALYGFGNYGTHVLSAGMDEYKNALNASVITAGGTGIGCYLFKIPLSRAYFILVFLIGIPLLLLGRFLLRRLLHRWRERGLFRQRVLVVGDEVHIDEIAQIMRREKWLGYHVVGALHPPHLSPERDNTPLGIPYLGTAEDTASLAAAAKADVLIIASRAFRNSLELRRTQWALEHLHVQVIVAPEITDISRERVSVRPVAGLPNSTTPYSSGLATW